MLRLDGGLDNGSAGQWFWALADRAEKEGSCDCVSCLSGERHNKISAAVSEAEVYKKQLSNLLGFDGSGKSTLELERERIREA